MISLTLIPIHRQAKIGPTQPIAGTSASSSSSSAAASQSNQPLRTTSFQGHSRQVSDKMSPTVQQRFSGGQSWGDTASAAAKTRLSVRLAEDNVLLPFHNRASEIKELLHENKRNRELIYSLEMLFSSNQEAWHQVRHLLYEVDRDELTDGQWLQQLFSIVFPKSAASWIRLADCIGAHDIAWAKYSSNDIYDSSEERIKYSSKHVRIASEDDDTVFGSEGPSSDSTFEFEALHEIPKTFKDAPIKMEKLSYRLDNDDEMGISNTDTSNGPVKHRRSSSVISKGAGSDIHTFLNGNQDGFAGVRLSCPIEGRKHTPKNDIETRSRSISAPSTMRGRRASDVSRLHKFAHHRRLSNLFMSSITDEPEKPDTSQQSRSNKSPRLQWAPDPPSYSSKSNQEDIASPSSPSSFARSFAARSRSASSPQVPTSNSAPTIVPEEECKIGLLPDGRTRHPSAGEGSKEAAALLAFKNELKLSGYKQEQKESEDDVDSPALSNIRSPSLSSDSSPARQYSASTPATSPELSKQALPKESFASAKQSSRPELNRKRSAAIFAVPRSTPNTRSKYLTELLAKEENKSAVEIVKEVLGKDRYDQLHQLISEKERDDIADEPLLELVGRDYFHLIDTEKDSKETIEACLVDDQYEARWSAFVKLCHAWKVDSHVLHEAKRRSGPAVKLF